MRDYCSGVLTLGQAPVLKQCIEIGQWPSIDGRPGHIVGGEIGGDGAYFGQQPGQRVAMPLGGDSARAFDRETGEADRATQVVRHAAPGAVEMQVSRRDAPDPDGSRVLVGLVGLGGIAERVPADLQPPSEFYGLSCNPDVGGRGFVETGCIKYVVAIA